MKIPVMLFLAGLALFPVTALAQLRLVETPVPSAQAAADNPALNLRLVAPYSTLGGLRVVEKKPEEIGEQVRPLMSSGDTMQSFPLQLFQNDLITTVAAHRAGQDVGGSEKRNNFGIGTEASFAENHQVYDIPGSYELNKTIMFMADVPFVWDSIRDPDGNFGVGDISMGMSLRAGDLYADGYRVIFSPKIKLPTGSAEKGTGNDMTEGYMGLALIFRKDRWMISGCGDGRVNRLGLSSTALFGLDYNPQFLSEWFFFGVKSFVSAEIENQARAAQFSLAPGVNFLYSKTISAHLNAVFMLSDTRKTQAGERFMINFGTTHVF